MDHFPELLKLTIAMIAVVDITSTIPVFLKHTANMGGAQRRMTAIVAGVTTALILLVFAQAGEVILETFGISIDAFRVLGGLVLLIMALEMLGLTGQPDSDISSGPMPDPIVTGIFPMAIPLSAGPGTVSAVMIYAHQNEIHPDWNNHISWVIVFVSILLTLALMTAALLASVITPVIQTVMNRVFGMIVGAMGVEFILDGLEGHMQAFTP
ncbi:MAG: MarC family protein [Pseudomonadota bacterium]